MARFAPVVPLSIARMLQEQGALGDYHLLLAHDVLAHPKEYQEIYGGKGYDIIMDNSLIELGHPLPMVEVLEAAEIVGAQKFVFPDTLGDFRSTYDKVSKALDEWYDIPGDFAEVVKPVAVVQGNNYEECVRCLEQYINWGIENISIPRVLVEKLGTRTEILMKALERGFSSIHLLGFSDDVLDDITCARLPGVSGIDSAVPVRAGIKEVDIRSLVLKVHGTKDAIGPRGDFWDTKWNDLNRYQVMQVLSNLANIRSFVNSDQ